jgi:hypothetical protein
MLISARTPNAAAPIAEKAAQVQFGQVHVPRRPMTAAPAAPSAGGGFLALLATSIAVIALGGVAYMKRSMDKSVPELLKSGIKLSEKKTKKEIDKARNRGMGVGAGGGTLGGGAIALLLSHYRKPAPGGVDPDVPGLKRDVGLLTTSVNRFKKTWGDYTTQQMVNGHNDPLPEKDRIPKFDIPQDSRDDMKDDILAERGYAAGTVSVE